MVGFEATEYEFPNGGSPSYDLYATPAFARTVLPRTGVDDLYLVRLRHGAADTPRFDAAANALGLEGYENVDPMVTAVEASIHPQAVGWWILAALAALVGLAVIGQALARQEIVESRDAPTLAALGVDRRQLFGLSMARNLTVGLLGAAGAVALATASSPIAPLGEARTAEISTGVAFDSLVLLLGALGTVAVTVAIGAWPAWRAARNVGRRDQRVAARPSAVAGQLAAIGAPPSVVIGVGNALGHRQGEGPFRSEVPCLARCSPWLPSAARWSSAPAWRTSRLPRGCTAIRFS